MDLIAFLTMLASAAGVAALAALSAKALEQWQAFQSVSPTGKTLIAVSIATLIGLAAKALTQYLSPRPDLVALAAPYWDVIYVAGTIAWQQISHATNRARFRGPFDGAQG